MIEIKSAAPTATEAEAGADPDARNGPSIRQECARSITYVRANVAEAPGFPQGGSCSVVRVERGGAPLPTPHSRASLEGRRSPGRRPFLWPRGHAKTNARGASGYHGGATK